MTTRIVLITGGITGIGRATAIAFAKAGDNVVIAGRRREVGQKTVEELRKHTAAEFIETDVRVDAQVRHLVDETVKRFGGLDVAVNAAGSEGKPGLLVDQTAESYAATFDTNVLGVVLSMKYELVQMLKQKSGTIINVSSTMGHKAAAGASIYTASKHALEGLSKAAALEVAASGIRVNVVAPGPVDTELLDRFAGTAERKKGLAAGVPLGRLGDVNDIAEAILFVASDNARYVTGNVLNVDGGKSAG